MRVDRPHPEHRRKESSIIAQKSSKDFAFEMSEFNKHNTFFNVEIQKINAQFFVLISQAKEDSIPYKLENECREVKVYYGQKNTKFEWVLPYKAATPFAWPEPSRNQLLEVRFVLRNSVMLQQEI